MTITNPSFGNPIDDKSWVVAISPAVRHAEKILDWDNEREELYLLLLPLVLEAAQRGALNALDMAGAGAIDFDALFADLATFAEDYARTLAGQVTDTTREHVTAILTAGGSLADLEPWLDADRAAAISISAITDLFAQGNVTAWLVLGLSLHTWHTAGDSLVCPLCRPNDGVTLPIGAPFPSGHTRPSAHARCRCWLSPVVLE